MLRCSEESHPPGAANGAYWTEAAGTHRCHPGRGTRGKGLCLTLVGLPNALNI